MGQVFSSPDWSQPLDMTVGGLMASYLFVTFFGNALKLPLVKREGGSLMAYSKFAKSVQNAGPRVGSRLGMFLLYLPSCLLGIFATTQLGKNPNSAIVEDRGKLLGSMITLHFAKRCLECLFLHNFSGDMPLATSFFIATGYLIPAAANCLFYQKETAPFSSESEILDKIGLALFAFGTSGNLYHHYLLARLRKPGEKKYKIPRGGLFNQVAAPHYFCEIIGWGGMGIFSRHLFGIGATVATSAYLADRASAQRAWNRENLSGYPHHIKRLVPFIF